MKIAEDENFTEAVQLIEKIQEEPFLVNGGDFSNILQQANEIECVVKKLSEKLESQQKNLDRVLEG